MKIHWLLLVSLGCVGVGCGDDDDEDGGNAGTSGTGSGNVTCDPEGDGDCENATDCPKVETGEARGSAQTCGVGCQQDQDPATCAVSCIVADVAITQACAVCYATLVGCASENCLTECGSDPTSNACAECQIESGCRGAFDTCSGLETAN